MLKRLFMGYLASNEWMFRWLNLQILKSSFRSSSLTHDPHCSIYKYKFGTDNRPCNFQGLYLCIYVEGPCASGLRFPQPKIQAIGGVVYQPMDLSPGWGMGLCTWRMVLANKRSQILLYGSCPIQGICKKAFWELNSSWHWVNTRPYQGYVVPDKRQFY